MRGIRSDPGGATGQPSPQTLCLLRGHSVEDLNASFWPQADDRCGSSAFPRTCAEPSGGRLSRQRKHRVRVEHRPVHAGTLAVRDARGGLQHRRRATGEHLDLGEVFKQEARHAGRAPRSTGYWAANRVSGSQTGLRPILPMGHDPVQDRPPHECLSVPRENGVHVPEVH